MKRSRVNELVAEGEDIIRSFGFVLPPFANWTPDAFKARLEHAGHIVDARCGWDVTDYGEIEFTVEQKVAQLRSRLEREELDLGRRAGAEPDPHLVEQALVRPQGELLRLRQLLGRFGDAPPQLMRQIVEDVTHRLAFLPIVLVLVVQGSAHGGMEIADVAKLLVSLPALIGFAWIVERHVLIRLIRKFDKIQEYIFLMTIGWCLGMAELASLLGLSAEIGAFIAGVVLASSPIAMFIAESLKPLRDFFLVLFFFSMGAGFDLAVLDQVIVPAAVLATLLMIAMSAWYRRVTHGTPR